MTAVVVAVAMVVVVSFGPPVTTTRSARETERDFEEWPGVDVREAVAVCALTILAGQCVSDSLFLSVCAVLRQMTSDELSLSRNRVWCGL